MTSAEFTLSRSSRSTPYWVMKQRLRTRCPWGWVDSNLPWHLLGSNWVTYVKINQMWSPQRLWTRFGEISLDFISIAYYINFGGHLRLSYEASWKSIWLHLLRMVRSTTKKIFIAKFQHFAFSAHPSVHAYFLPSTLIIFAQKVACSCLFHPPRQLGT